MVDVKSRKCRTRGGGRKPSFGAGNTRTAEFFAQHASLKRGVGGYREGEVDPHHSGKVTIGNIRPNGVKFKPFILLLIQALRRKVTRALVSENVTQK